MQGPAAAFLLEANQLLAGTFIFMWIAMLGYRSIDRGHFRTTTWVVAPLVFATSLGLDPGVKVPGMVTALLMGSFLIAVYSQRPLFELILGGAATGAGSLLLFQTAVMDCEVACGLTLVHALGGTLFLGSLTHAMVLGHWYLNQPRLPIEPLKGATAVMLGGVLASLILGVVTRGSLIEANAVAGVLSFSEAAYWWGWLVAMVTISAISVMVRSTVWSRSTQSATGLLYVAMIPALGGQFVLNLLAS